MLFSQTLTPSFVSSQVTHKAVLTVNEKSTEAAGATATELVSERKIEITYNRPFTVIINGFTGLPLFTGSIWNPLS